MAATAGRSIAYAQTPGKVPRIGFLGQTSPSRFSPLSEVLLPTSRDGGVIFGRRSRVQVACCLMSTPENGVLCLARHGRILASVTPFDAGYCGGAPPVYAISRHPPLLIVQSSSQRYDLRRLIRNPSPNHLHYTCSPEPSAIRHQPHR
jgi:hypothetical protein